MFYHGDADTPVVSAVPDLETSLQTDNRLCCAHYIQYLAIGKYNSTVINEKKQTKYIQIKEGLELFPNKVKVQKNDIEMKAHIVPMQ